MALPSAYTEKTFADYLHQLNPAQAATLGWVVGAADAGSYAEIVNDTLLGCSVDDIGELAGRVLVAKLRAIGRACYWRAVMEGHTNKISFGVDGSRYERKDLFNQAKAAYAVALAEAAGYGYSAPGAKITVKRIVRGDPYRNGAE